MSTPALTKIQVNDPNEPDRFNLVIFRRSIDLHLLIEQLDEEERGYIQQVLDQVENP